MFSDTVDAWPESLLHAGVNQMVGIEKIPEPVSYEGSKNFSYDWLKSNQTEILGVRCITLFVYESDSGSPPDIWKIISFPTCRKKSGQARPQNWAAFKNYYRNGINGTGRAARFHGTNNPSYILISGGIGLVIKGVGGRGASNRALKSSDWGAFQTKC